MVTKGQALVLGAIATALTIIGALIAMWPMMGWQTPNQHDADVFALEADHAESQEPVLSAIQALSVKIDLNADRWQCDEDTEELIEKMKEQAVGHTVEREVEIKKINNRMDEIKCTRFND